MTDANQRWDVAEAIAWMKPLAKYNVLWIEEPTSPDDILGHLEIAKVINDLPQQVMLFCSTSIHNIKNHKRACLVCCMTSGLSLVQITDTQYPVGSKPYWMHSNAKEIIDTDHIRKDDSITQHLGEHGKQPSIGAKGTTHTIMWIYCIMAICHHSDN